MTLDLSGRAMLDMIECLFVGRPTVTSFEVVQESRFHDLGRDGRRAVHFLEPGRYTREELKAALVDASIATYGERFGAGEASRLTRPA